MTTQVAGGAPRSRLGAIVFGAMALAVAVTCLALGTWQLQRRHWKLDLIARVEERLAAAPVPAPGPAEWPTLSADSAEYARVALAGTFLYERESLVQAVTIHGPGFWVMTPLETDRGFTVLVNRGFVPPDRRERGSRAAGNPAGPVRIAGLLRLTEPGGGFLRSNDPQTDRWYSRDVAAIATARRLTREVAPYFVDADGAANEGGFPIGGLTVVGFRNQHLVYALTWFGLAAMASAALVHLLRRELEPNSPPEDEA